MPVVGVDGCRAGWVVAAADFLVVAPTFADVLGLAGDDGLVGIDIPIGLADSGARECDREARRLLAPARSSSVFPAPLRPALHCTTWADAAQVYRAVNGTSLSQQAFGIFAKVREVDSLMAPRRQRAVVEVHPELSFALMADGRPMPHPKRTPLGHAQRRAALQAAGIDPPQVVPAGAAPDDVFDAYAVLWTALRTRRGDERRLGDGAVDATGLRMEIVG